MSTDFRFPLHKLVRQYLFISATSASPTPPTAQPTTSRSGMEMTRITPLYWPRWGHQSLMSSHMSLLSAVWPLYSQHSSLQWRLTQLQASHITRIQWRIWPDLLQLRGWARVWGRGRGHQRCGHQPRVSRGDQHIRRLLVGGQGAQRSADTAQVSQGSECQVEDNTSLIPIMN